MEVKNIKELRSKLVETFKGLLSGNVERKDATESNNTAGKIINTIRTQLEYAKLRKEEPEIEFMKCN